MSGGQAVQRGRPPHLWTGRRRTIDAAAGLAPYRAMTAAARASPTPDTQVRLAGTWLTPLSEGALWWGEQATLIVSDLHLEKGSSYARKGQMLPPYDTAATLSRVEALTARLAPERVISLGDSFHDRGAEVRLPAASAARIRALTSRHDWVWVEGNHDPAPPSHLGGRAAGVLRIAGLTFRHEPTGEAGEIAGHLHPAARVRGRGRSIRRRCFATDGERLVMPALGAYTGGLNVCDAAFSAVFPSGLMAFALGEGRVYALAGGQLVADGPRTAHWRL